jgi:hypothetical protein
MRQAIELTGPGASPEEVAAALGVTPERQAAIRDILGLRVQEKPPRDGSEHTLIVKKPSEKKAARRR